MHARLLGTRLTLLLFAVVGAQACGSDAVVDRGSATRDSGSADRDAALRDSGSTTRDAAAGDSAVAAGDYDPQSVVLPGLEDGNGFDDLRYSVGLKKLLAPGNFSGNIYVIDPETLEVETIGGFSSAAAWDGGDMQGPASVEEGDGLIFVGDRTAMTLSVVDPKTKEILASTMLGGFPDYLRFFPGTHEVWVTEPFNQQVEVLSIPQTGTPTPKHEAFVKLDGYPEGIGFDAQRKLAFTQTIPGLGGNAVMVMDIATRVQIATWDSGCATGTHGNPLTDSKRGLLFATCSDAEVVVLDLDHDGSVIDSLKIGAGASIPAYAPLLHHFYLRGDPGIPIAILDVAADGKLKLLGKVDSVDKAHCLAADDAGHFFTGDWNGGQVLRFTDPY